MSSTLRRLLFLWLSLSLQTTLPSLARDIYPCILFGFTILFGVYLFVFLLGFFFTNLLELLSAENEKIAIIVGSYSSKVFFFFFAFDDELKSSQGIPKTRLFFYQCNVMLFFFAFYNEHILKNKIFSL